MQNLHNIFIEVTQDSVAASNYTIPAPSPTLNPRIQCLSFCSGKTLKTFWVAALVIGRFRGGGEGAVTPPPPTLFLVFSKHFCTTPTLLTVHLSVVIIIQSGLNFQFWPPLSEFSGSAPISEMCITLVNKIILLAREGQYIQE